MEKTIVVFADGTGNSAAKTFKSNVWRLYQALDLTCGDQIAVFDDGVGTSSFKPLQYLGLAFGVGVKRNVINLYKFLCLNYRKDDHIYGFGFSRGAFTIRVLNGLISREGLVSFKSEEELHRNAVAAYRAFRRDAFRKAAIWVKWGRSVRDLIIYYGNRITGGRTYDEVRQETKEQSRDKIAVRFLGLWDTVAAYGLPIDELTRAVDKWVWPLSFRDTTLPGNVEFARHALSLDDERRTFFPILWDDPNPPQRAAGQPLDDARLLQVWFAGVHANVGGGYPDDGLAHVPLCWMIGEAARRGLRFKDWVVAGYAAIASENGRIYDSRSGFGTFYRYHPRLVGELMTAGTTPLIDGSVVMRMAFGNDAYAPISLPERIDVLAPDNTAIPFGNLTAAAGAETIADPLPLPPGQQRNLSANRARLRTAIAELSSGSAAAQRNPQINLVLDTVWWRRVVYFLTLLLTLFAVAYPIVIRYVHTGATDYFDAVAGFIKDLLGLAREFLPGFAAPWLDAIGQHPTVAGLTAAGIFGCLSVSSLLQTRIRDRARAAWSVRARKDAHHLGRSRLDAQRQAAWKGVVFFLIATIMVLAAGNSWAVWGIPVMPVLLGAMAICFVICFALQARIIDSHTNPTAPGWFLRVARKMRESAPACALYRLSAEHILPAFFLVGAAILTLFFANRATFDMLNSAGLFCKTSISDQETERIGRAYDNFRTNAICWPSGLVLTKGEHYWIRLEMPPETDWFDRTVHTDVGGFPARRLPHFLSTLLKRWWGRPWFKPIARIGTTGNDEYVLDPANPLPPPPDEDPAISVHTGFFAPIDRAIAERETQDNPRRDERRTLVAEITARNTGELFLYVNDAVLTVPFLTDLFYRNNTGTATITIERIEVPPPRDERKRATEIVP